MILLGTASGLKRLGGNLNFLDENQYTVIVLIIDDAGISEFFQAKKNSSTKNRIRRVCR